MEEDNLDVSDSKGKNKFALLIFFFVFLFGLAGFFVYKYKHVSIALKKKEPENGELGSVQSPTPSPINSKQLESGVDDASESGQIRNIDGMKIEDLKVGSGEEAVNGKLVVVNYVGKLMDGTVFDSTENYGKPFAFTLGKGEVIKGWDEGVLGMKIGGKRKLTIPPEMAYGDREMGNIPANSTLVFEIELLEIKNVR